MSEGAKRSCRQRDTLRLDRFDADFAARMRTDDLARILIVRDHPDYLRGVLQYDALIPPLFTNNVVLNRAVTEINRFQMTVYALHLYDTFDPADVTTGLTLSRLQSLCLTHDLASAGGTTAYVGLLLVAGYLARQRSKQDRRIVHLVPTTKFVTIVEHWNRAILQSLDAMEPEAALATAHEHHPRFGWDMRKRSTQMLLAGWKPLQPFPEVDHFLLSHGGWMLLNHCVAETLRQGACKTIEPVAIDLETFGKRFCISRSQLRRILEGAHDKDLLDAAPRNGRHVLVSERLLCATLAAQASELAAYRQAAHETKAALMRAATI